jgi:hypothetical protein
MRAGTFLVVTSINSPNAVLHSLAKGAKESGVQFIVVGDRKSPPDFTLENCDYYSLTNQQSLGFRFAAECPAGHYSRKNIGYLIALKAGAEIIIETDDDNHPRPNFWVRRVRSHISRLESNPGWVNVYRHFTDTHIWPRGLPLDEVTKSPAPISDSGLIESPIQQALADENPDVDAIYRLTLPLPQSFREEQPVALGRDVWCPFNSQNTTWWKEAAPLLYLPSFCSFRMTDIWRSFVAQRIAWENGWHITFHSASVWQKRNEHNLMKDFEDEVPGYLHNRKICERLSRLELAAGPANQIENLTACYTALIDLGVIEPKELGLLEAWSSDLGGI